MAGSAVDEIKARVDVADVIGQYVPLKRTGRTLKGLCPFHGEKTPSFIVWPETGTWRCFGCGEGGDVFTFVEKRENLEFGEALRLLAARAGVDLPSHERHTPEEEQAEQRLRAVLASAEMYFRAALAGSSGVAARAYLAGRGVNAESVERFGLGFAPASGLLRYLQDNGCTPAEAVEVGVAGQRDEGRAFEWFRDRLMIPIRDPNGQTISFGGRLLGDGQPKYLNGPQTRFFDKGGCLFALDLARASIRQSGRAVIVEGYLDALMAHQYGYQNVVATLGTALTERHLDLLGKRATEIILALDADAAGQAATMRGLEVAQNAAADDIVPVVIPGVRGLVRYQAVRRSQIKVLTMPAGMDPDDLVRSDPAEWGRLVGDASPVVDFVLNRLAGRYDLTSAAGKREAVQEAMGMIRDLADRIEQEHYLQRLASLVGLDESALRGEFNRVRSRATRAGATPEAANAAPPSLPEAYLLALSFLAGEDAALLASDNLVTPEGRALVAVLGAVPTGSRTEAGLAELAETSDPSLRPALATIGAWLPRIAPLPPAERQRELEVATLNLRRQQLNTRHREVLSLLREPDDDLDRPTAASWLATIAAQLREIETALAAKHGLGSIFWRSRQVGEVLGG